MEETKEKTPITALDLLRDNLVGLVGETEEGKLTFTLPGGQTFEIFVR